MNQGKILPQSIEVEKAYLGLLIINPEKINDSQVSNDEFYNPNHKAIFQIIKELSRKNSAIDPFSIEAEMKRKSLPTEIISELITFTSTLAESESLEKIIKEKYLLREIVKHGNELMNHGFSENDPFEIIANTQLLFARLSGVGKTTTHHISESLEKLYALVNRNYDGNFKLTGIPTGFMDFDRRSGGLQKSDLIVIAGETSQGKTSFALKIASHASLMNKKVGIFSYEMSDIQLSARLVSSISKVAGSSIQYHKLSTDDFQSVQEGIGELMNTNIFIDDVPITDYDYLEKSIRATVIKQGIDLVIIDYLQLISVHNVRDSKADRVAMIANGLKGLAKSLNVPVILVSQLSRGIGEPNLGRLKGSGDIENAADVVLFVYRPEYYGEVKDVEINGQYYSPVELAKITNAKGRNIGVFEFPAKFTANLTLFEEYEQPKRDLENGNADPSF